MTHREASKQAWRVTDGAPSIGEINTGSLQRIADATEAMARRFNELLAENEDLKERLYAVRVERDAMMRRCAALQGVITKMKAKVASD